MMVVMVVVVGIGGGGGCDNPWHALVIIRAPGGAHYGSQSTHKKLLTRDIWCTVFACDIHY